MRLHRFYIPQPIPSKGELTVHSEDLAHQIRKVFRLRTGDQAKLFDGSGRDYACAIERCDDASVVFSVGVSEPSPFMPTRDIYLCAAVVKKDTFEWIVEKATELGVTHVIPLMAERSEKKALNEERLKKIAIEATEQSGRGTIPAIHPIIKVENSVDFLGTISSVQTKRLVFHIEGDKFKRSDIEGSSPLAVFIGPEGGWSPAEIELFHKDQIPVVCLGSQVLRAETAVVAALSVIVFS